MPHTRMWPGVAGIACRFSTHMCVGDDQIKIRFKKKLARQSKIPHIKLDNYFIYCLNGVVHVF